LTGQFKIGEELEGVVNVMALILSFFFIFIRDKLSSGRQDDNTREMKQKGKRVRMDEKGTGDREQERCEAICELNENHI
jgi:hypothetical protein